MPGDFGHLVKGRRYEVVREFVDFDGIRHPAGESWTYIGHSFLPYEDGLTLLVRPGEAIRLQWRPESQGAIIDRLDTHLRQLDS
ncbi:DUF3601 domain-containing protein [Inquilinus limosus]|uniref:DUF3601 domain-containing protein n=1 Tax=Inquilinus limosus TaxID=171674 RepID=UPI003F169E47